MEQDNEERHPEWDIFGRQESVEKRTQRLEQLGRQGRKLEIDTYLIATMALKVAFQAYHYDAVRDARLGKDTMLETLKQAGLSSIALQTVQDELLDTCEFLEKPR